LSALTVAGQSLAVKDFTLVLDNHKINVSPDSIGVTVIPTWSGDASVTVSSSKLISGEQLTAPTSVTSGGSVDVQLATGHRFGVTGDEWRTLVTIEMRKPGALRRRYGVRVYKMGGDVEASISVSPNPVMEGDGGG